jgi:hypothetical protein
MRNIYTLFITYPSQSAICKPLTGNAHLLGNVTLRHESRQHDQWGGRLN